MMTENDADIPQDVMEIASKVFEKGLWEDIYGFIQRQHAICVAKAIMEERERCAVIAECYDHGTYAAEAIRGEKFTNR